MPRLALLAVWLMFPLAALAADPALESLKGRFSEKEQVLLSGLLSDPARAQQFSAEGQTPDAAFMTRWRGRLAVFSQEYLAKEHPLNESARALKQAVEPAEWAALMSTLRFLRKSDDWTDQAKLKIFIGMIEDAEEGLKAGDPSKARKVAGLAKPQLESAFKAYLATPLAQASLAELQKSEAAEAQARREALAKTAKEQAEAAERRSQEARLAPPEKAAEDAGGGFERSKAKPPAVGTPVEPPPVEEEVKLPNPAIPLTKPVPGAKPPSLTVKPPPPDGADDMAELRQIKQENAQASGHRKWLAAGAGALLGGLLGLFFGPLGALLGAALGGAAGFIGGKKLWG